jgi:hypothetical protein
MSPEQIKSAVEAALRDSSGLVWWHYLLAILLIAAFSYLGAYLSGKGQGLAKKEDIKELTLLVESVKQELRSNEAIAEAKRRMKYEACLEALNVIDAFFSHSFLPLKPTPQVADAARTREAHSKLILSCDNPKIVELFTEILCGPETGQRKPPTDQLNEFRNLVRKELGFGSDVELDRNRAWVGKVVGDPKTL